MFPVPAHLPRKGGEHLASPPTEQPQSQAEASGSSSVESMDKVPVDAVLDIFEPLFRDKELKSGTIRGVREKLQKAARDNKVRLLCSGTAVSGQDMAERS